MTLLLQGGTVVDPSQKIEKRLDLLVEKGRVAALGEIKPKKSWEVVDVSKCVVAPGFIDCKFFPVSINDSPLLTLLAEILTLMESAPRRLAAISKDDRVRVEGS